MISVFLRALAEQVKEYNCYLLDLPGHGGSEDTGYTAENYTDHISDFLKNMDNIILIGHSNKCYLFFEFFRIFFQPIHSKG